jgi:hypothetical protein
MPKTYFCSNCGTPLRWSRKALRNRQVIVDLIDPHECDAENIVNIQDSETPTKNAITFDTKEMEDRITRSLTPEDDEPDRRPPEQKRKVKSTAPINVLSAVKNQVPTKPTSEFEDLDKELSKDD